MNGTEPGNRIAQSVAHLRQTDAGMGRRKSKTYHPREDGDGECRYDREKNIIPKFPVHHEQLNSSSVYPENPHKRTLSLCITRRDQYKKKSEHSLGFLFTH
jgi:hypothetical protein